MGRRAAECATVARGFGAGAAAGLFVLLLLAAKQAPPGAQEARRRLYMPQLTPQFAPNEGPRKNMPPGCLAGTGWQVRPLALERPTVEQAL
jgi:hypothetical protein